MVFYQCTSIESFPSCSIKLRPLVSLARGKCRTRDRREEGNEPPTPPTAVGKCCHSVTPKQTTRTLPVWQVRGEGFRHMHPVRGGVSVGRWSSIGAGYKAKLFFNPARYIQRICCCSLVTVLTPSEVAICIVCTPRGLPSFDQYSYSSAVTTRNSNFAATKWTFFSPDTHFKHPSCSRTTNTPRFFDTPPRM